MLAAAACTLALSSARPVSTMSIIILFIHVHNHLGLQISKGTYMQLVSALCLQILLICLPVFSVFGSVEPGMLHASATLFSLKKACKALMHMLQRHLTQTAICMAWISPTVCSNTHLPVATCTTTRYIASTTIMVHLFIALLMFTALSTTSQGEEKGSEAKPSRPVKTLGYLR